MKQCTCGGIKCKNPCYDWCDLMKIETVNEQMNFSQTSRPDMDHYDVETLASVGVLDWEAPPMEKAPYHYITGTFYMFNPATMPSTKIVIRQDDSGRNVRWREVFDKDGNNIGSIFEGYEP